MRAFEERIADGYLFGDFQFKTDESAEDFLETGVFSCYRPLGEDAPRPEHIDDGYHPHVGVDSWSWHTPTRAGVRGIFELLPDDIGSEVLVGYPSTQRLHRRLPRLA